MDATTDQRVARLPNDEELRQWQYALALRIVDLGRDAGHRPASPSPTPPEPADVSAQPEATVASPSVGAETNVES
jgi:hypothetical protein